MAYSTCPKGNCNGTSFEMKELKVQKSAFRLQAIQCTSCGAVISVTEMYNVIASLEKIAKKLGTTIF